MDISIITPIYNGNKFLNNYIDKVNDACQNKESVEIIFVNDSPEIKIKYDLEKARKLNIRVLENERNLGIHKSRINGLKYAKGKYILFLDQDDEIMPNTLKSQFDVISKNNSNLVLGNGYFEDKNGLHLIYKNKFSQKFASKKKSNIMIRDFIVSPGQCLIKKEIIPEYWINNVLNKNGTDDFLLWLLIYNENDRKMALNPEIIYIHKYTGENLSLNNTKMYDSQLNLLKLLKQNKNYKRSDYNKLERTIKYKHNYKIHFITETIKNLDIFLYNIIYKIIWRGYTIHEKK